MPKVYFDIDDDLLNPCFDNVFKAMFTKDTEQSRIALMGLLTALLDKTVIDVAVKQNEPSINLPDDKQIRFDINCTFNGGELADIEMTISPDKCEVMRMEYYCARLYTSQDIKGTDKSYDDLKHTYQISIVGESIFNCSNFLHRFEYTDQYGEHLGGRTHIVILELSKLSAVLEKPVEQFSKAELWSVFFKYSPDKDKRQLVNEILSREESITMAGELLQTLSKDDHVRARLLTEYKNIVDYQSGMVEARRKGEAEGIKMGKAEGKLEGKLETAANLKGLGISNEQISKATGLSLEEVEKL